MSMALLSTPPSHFPTLSPPNSLSKTHLTVKPTLSLRPKRHYLLISTRVSDNGSGVVVVEDEKKEEASVVVESEQKVESSDGSLETNGSPAVAAGSPVEVLVGKYENPKWVNGTWDLKQFQKDGTTDWDAVIDAEVKRRKWLEDNPESSNNDYPVVFDTSIVPWWAWVKRFHLPEAELLNGRAAMVGFFMAYFVDSLTGIMAAQSKRKHAEAPACMGNWKGFLKSLTMPSKGKKKKKMNSSSTNFTATKAKVIMQSFQAHKNKGFFKKVLAAIQKYR